MHRLAAIMQRDTVVMTLASFTLIACSVARGGEKRESMTRIEFSFEADLLRSARPKTIYVAGDRYARIEEFADATSGVKNLIVVSEPDIWLVDAVRKTVGHAVNHETDPTVHNPILGPDGPEELFALEYGREVSFFEEANASRLAAEELYGKRCDVREIIVAEYRLRLYVDPHRRTPIAMKAFKDGELLFGLRYSNYQTDLPFDLSIFRPPKGLTLIEASE
ncbi:MAG TPA: hypothetical protein VEP30_04795 [Chthoniobacterales bacterium]|nr:hypothetical protein [Chthoniobacterales bacterium]